MAKFIDSSIGRDSFLEESRTLLKSSCHHFLFLTINTKRNRKKDSQIIDKYKRIFDSLANYLNNKFFNGVDRCTYAYVIEKTKKKVPHIHGYLTLPIENIKLDFIKSYKYDFKTKTTSDNYFQNHNIVTKNGKTIKLGDFMCEIAGKIHGMYNLYSMFQGSRSFYNEYFKFRSPLICLKYGYNDIEILKWFEYISKEIK